MNRTIPTGTYFTATEHLSKIYEKTEKKLAYRASDPGQAERWKRQARDTLRELTGIDRMEWCELTPMLVEREQMDGYRREKWLIQTEPDIWMPFYILLPDSAGPHDRRSCVIAPHGHLEGGKYSVAGRRDIPAVKDIIEQYNYDYSVQFVRRGFIVCCPDARAFGERREWMKHSEDEEPFMTSTCIPLNHMAICLGQSLTGMWTWDLMRLVDYVETRQDCDARRIGCAGLSGGGLQTLWLSALDDRIQCAVISGYFYGYKDSLLLLSDNCGCNYVPGLWNHADMGDLGALIAPRPLLIETGTNDHLNGHRGLANVLEQVDITGRAYRLFDMEHRLQHCVFDGGHKWNGAAAYSFMDRWLNGERTCEVAAHDGDNPERPDRLPE